MDSDSAILNVNNQYSNGHDISENATILEEGLRVCPLCQSEIKLFFINFNEKLLMCENVECEYPFGHEDLQFVKEDNSADSKDELCSIPSKRTIDNNSATCSVVSAAAWSEIDRMNRVFESDDSQFETIPKTYNRVVDKKLEKERKALKNAQCIKGLNNELKKMSCRSERKIIANKKYIKNLMSLQAISGREMLQPEELNILNKEKETAEVKINVNTDLENCISTIKIELVDITNQENAAAEKNKGVDQ